MKILNGFLIRRLLQLGFLALAFVIFALPAASARTITLSLEFARQQYSTLDPFFQGQTYYTVFVSVSSDIPPVTYDEVDSPAPDVAFGGSESGNGYSSYPDLASVLNEATNGVWTLTVNKGDASEKQYTFKVSASGLDPSNFPPVQIFTPGDGDQAVSTNVQFSWSGPASWDELDLADHTLDNSFYTSESPSPDTTTWNDAPLVLGTNEFEVTYKTNAAAWITISTPLDSLSQPFTNWVSGSKLDDFVQSGFVTSTNPVIPGTGHTLVAHYTFDDAGNLGTDSSGNGYSYNASSGGDNGSIQPTNDAEVGGGAIDFFRNDSDPFSVAVQGWYPTTPAGILSALQGSFSVSVWVKTTSSIGNSVFNGSAVIAADVGGVANDTVPIALVGGEVAFNTGGDEDDTLNSSKTVNNGSYRHIVVTRDQATGNKAIYIDGVLDSTGSGTTNLLNDPKSVLIGGIDDAGNPTFGASSFYGGFDGKMDDLQIYSGVLSSTEIASLHANPGSTAANVGGNDFDIALNTTNLTWTTSGDTDWFTENTYTYDGIEAAQSGSVTNNQSSTLSVTVTGPGTVTFYWSSIANDPNQDFDYEFYIDDPNSGDDGDLFGDNSWQQAGPFIVQPGQHTLNWTVYAGGDTEPAQAGFLDQVIFLPDTSPVITENPFNQTNHSGYNVALLAAATSPSPITWQWFELGNPSPLPNATNALFIPVNSGTADVAGSYYAVASTPGGSANTTTALVSFVSAPLPPNWSVAMKSPFAGVDPSAVTKDLYGGCVVGSTGNVYVADQYIGNVDVLTNGFVENILTAVGTNGGAALVKHDANGNPLWAVGLTNNQPGSYSFADCVALAPGNGAYLASIVVGTNWLGTNKFVDVGGSSLLISRFDANGSNIWSRFIGGTNGISIFYNCLASDAAGNVTVAGTASGTFSLGSTNLTAPPSGQAGFLAQYDANGTLRWTQVFPEWVTDVTYGGGIIYVSLWSGFGAAGPIVTNSIGGLSVMTDRQWAIASLNATNGQGFWLHGLGAPYGSHLGVIDDVPLLSVSSSDVFVMGTAYGTGAQFGGLAVSLTGGRGQYFARYDTNGNAQVATSFGSPTTTTWASAANAFGVYVTGDFDYYSQFGGDFIAAPVYAQNDLGPSYFTQPFVAKFDRNGNPLWAQNGVSSDEANFRGIAVATDGVWASGFFKVNDTNSVPARFGTNTLFSDRQSLFGGEGGSTSLLWYPGGVLAKITETTLTATPVTLLNPQDNGANFQFQFLSQSGFNHAILYRTNLAIGNWLTNSTVSGDGTVKTISLPFSLFSPAKQGFIRVSTQ